MPRPRRYRQRRWPVVVVLLFLTLGVTSGVLTTSWQDGGRPGAAPRATAAVTTTAAPTPTPTPTADPDVAFSLVAAGDVLPHMPVLSSARTAEGYDFSALLSGLDPWVRGADLALCHLEVPVAPPGVAPSGYPIFGTPAQIAADLREQGWDGCSTASNHSVDRGFAGVTATLDALDAAGLGHAGTARSRVEADQPQLYRLERSGRTVTVAHLAAAFGTNGMPVGADEPWSVDLIDVSRIVAQATAARAAGADLVLVSLHCCTEYVTQPTGDQVADAQALADSGVVDLVIGHHAHVPQPIAKLPGGPRGEGMWVAYGLGNYLSNQDDACCVAGTAAGELLSVELHATGAFPARGIAAGPVRVAAVSWAAITVDRTGGHQVHALVDIAGGSAGLSADQVGARRARVAEAAGVQAPERTTPLTPTGPEPVVVPRTTG